MSTKKEFKYFTIFNHEKEQDYLQEQHKKGWKLIKITGLGMYHFEQCEPEEVIYQLDYNLEGAKHKDEYIQMFEDCGWEYILEFVDYYYFRKPMKDMDEKQEEIFCDESSRLAMMDRVYKGRLIPLLAIFCGCFLPQFMLNAVNGNFLLAGFHGGILGIYIAFFAYSAIHYYRKKNK